MKIKTNRFAPVASMIIILFVLAILLAACGSAPLDPFGGAAPEYGKVVTETSVPATATSDATATPAITLTPTQRPNAKEAVVAWTKVVMTFDATESATVVIDRICALASEYGCWGAQAWNRKDFYAKYPAVKSQPVIKSVKLLYAGKMSDGVEYEVWEVMGEHSNPWLADYKSFNRYPAFVWSEKNQRWEFFYSPDGWTAKSLEVCGQFVEYAPDGHMYENEAEWKTVYTQCQTATPLPPTPFVPVTPVFTPKP